jgi:hypothetical protein
MALNAYFQPLFEQAALGQKLANLTSDTLECGLSTGTLPARSTTENWEFVSTLTGSIPEVLTTGGTNYARVALTGVTYTQSGLVVELDSAAIAFNSASNFTCNYAWIYDASIGGSDAAHPLILIFDLGGAQSPAGVPFSLTPNASGLATWTAAQ